jgi:ATP synthase protein I
MPEPSKPTGSRSRSIPPSEPSDPRLRIPDILKQPGPKGEFDPLTGGRSSPPEVHDVSGMGKAWSTALDFVFSILAGAFVGWLADRWRNTLPLWTLVGLALGFVTGFIRIVRATQRQERAEREARSRR